MYRIPFVLLIAVFYCPIILEPMLSSFSCLEALIFFWLQTIVFLVFYADISQVLALACYQTIVDLPSGVLVGYGLIHSRFRGLV